MARKQIKGPRVFESFYPGLCPKCGQPFLAGSSILFERGKGNLGHVSCDAARTSGTWVSSHAGPLKVWTHADGGRLVEKAHRDGGTRVYEVRDEDARLIESYKDGEVKSALPGEVLATGRGDRLQECRECPGLITAFEMYYWKRREPGEKFSKARHANASECGSGAVSWSRDKVKRGHIWSRSDATGKSYFAEEWTGGRYGGGFRKDYFGIDEAEALERLGIRKTSWLAESVPESSMQDQKGSFSAGGSQ